MRILFGIFLFFIFSCITVSGETGNETNPDIDGDSVSNNMDFCPKVIGTTENDGCPRIETNTYTQGDLITYAGVRRQQNSQQGDGTSDTDSDGVFDNADICPTIIGSNLNFGCPLVGSFLGNIEKNSCIMNQMENFGGIVIEPICEACPCDLKVSLGNALKRCDVIFPAILSKDLLNIYSRGPLFQIQ